ncbi:cytidine deaminase [Aliiroseovarius sp. KMU-50]|uniref:Cytidine deaminase n=1 Tax=Aliiroseovarius salicola TaxID=3009082 RepID=A0ABT4W5H9_9RHOB|nr:cytidine deaminase [Aliiroseovarius sp. KMU-50]MDA5095644.1 cytidine deaminase [Aliiroseovarius sp. KMU-50]
MHPVALRVRFVQLIKTEGHMSLLKAATSVRENAHAPYSNFKVGAALRTKDGNVYAGCNVENIAYPEGTCAEAGAIAAMCAAGEREIAEVLVIADAPLPVTPCGGCRQKLAEFSEGDVQITMTTTEGNSMTMSMEELLPGAFASKHMENT